MSAASAAVWDKDALLRVMRGNRESVCRIFRAFLEERPRYLETLCASIASADAEALQQAAHRLKGSAGMLRAGVVHDLAAKLEAEAKHGTMADACQLLHKLEQALRELESLFVREMESR